MVQVTDHFDILEVRLQKMKQGFEKVDKLVSSHL